MSLLLVCSLLLGAGEIPEDAVRAYLKKCEAAKGAAVAAKEAELATLTGEKLARGKAELTKLQKSPAPPLRLSLPPQKGDLGTFAIAKELPGGKSLTVLEVVDRNNAIVRAWYTPSQIPGQPAEEPTFVDVWIQGIDTGAFAAGAAADLPSAFYVTGSKLIDTTCGKRSFPLLEPVEIEKYRKMP